MLEEIEKQSRALLEKGTATRFVDKGEDSKGVARLIERLREAITHYQVGESHFAGRVRLTRRQISQQQAIYDRITNLTVSTLRSVPSHSLMIGPFVKASFNTLLKLHEVMRFRKLVTISPDS